VLVGEAQRAQACMDEHACEQRVCHA